jgi:Fis family transcriptional regulator
MNVARKGGGERAVACLRDNVREAMERYFHDMDGHDPADLYELFLSQVERPLFEVVLENTGGNLSRAAQMLGLNRATLRSRLEKYGIKS